MESRLSEQFVENAVSVKDYAYLENKNYPIKQTMEDAHFVADNLFKDGSGLFAVLDGHGGSEVVQHCAKVIPNLFKRDYSKGKDDIPKYFYQVFKNVDNQLKLVGASQSGCCCCVVFIRKEGSARICYVANLGDTRAVLEESGKARRVSTDHKVSNESQQIRIKNGGGVIMRGRVSGQLAVTRALGDLDLKKQGVTNEPDVQVFEISAKTGYLIIASDGIWDVLQDQKAVELCSGLSSKDKVKTLVDYAMKNGSRDNISAMVLTF